MFELSPTEWTAILLSLRVAVIATLVATPLGIGVGGCWRGELLGASRLSTR